MDNDTPDLVTTAAEPFEPLVAPEGEAEPAEAQATPPPPAEPDPATIADWLAQADEKALAKLPAWNKHVQRTQAKVRRELEEESVRVTAERSLVEQWRTWFDQLDDGQLREALKREDYRKAYDKVASYQERQSPVAAKIASEIVTGLQQRLKERDEFKDLPWDELLAVNDPAEFISNVIDRSLEKERRAMGTNLAKEIDAKITEALAKRNLTTDEAPSVPAEQFTPQGNDWMERFDPRNQGQLDRALKDLGFDPRRM